MKIIDKIATSTKPFYTFEFFPPRTEQGFENLLIRISRLATLNPLAISATWGAGGSTKVRSLELAGLTQSDYGLDTILHLTCTNMEKGMVDETLKAAKDRGIQNILALRGDPPRGAEEWLPIDSRFRHGADLVRYIRSVPEYATYFCIGVAAYPDIHPESTADADAEIEFLKDKVDAGADFIITQFFYDVESFSLWLNKVRDKGINIPIIPGIMPMQTLSSFKRITKLCGTNVPAFISAELDPISHDDQLVKEYGISLAVNMIEKLMENKSIYGVHFFTLNLEKSVQRILARLRWTGAAESIHNKLIADLPDDFNSHHTPDLEFLVTPTTAADTATKGLASIPASEGEVGRGELNNATTWDEFPNGRFGDYKSPAFGDQGLWGSPGISKDDPVFQWGSPKTLNDLTNFFLDHLQGKIATTPFSQGPFSLESQTIMPHLEQLTKKSWWTVGSQPAIDSTSSSDPIVGWGPRGGYVFQKSFVEFFCDEDDVDLIQRQAQLDGAQVHWLAANNRGDFRTNVPDESRNAVTWGIFPGQEVVQTTIIEPESFLSWKEEAFSVWSDWASFYPPQSQARSLLEHVRDQRWLVSIIHHDYKNAQALWNFLHKLTTPPDLNAI